MSSLTFEHYEQMSSYIPEGFEVLSVKGFLLINLILSSFIVVRYFLMVLPFYLLFFKEETDASKSKRHKLKPRQVMYEIKHSMISTVFFSLSGYFLALFWQLGWSQIYLKFDEYSYFYLPISFLIFALIHEVYFYFTHVWMHKPQYFRKIHAVHHYSQRTTPWASFSFHPFECIVHAVFLPILVLFVPIHPVVLIGYLTFMTLTAISNHLGAELIPSKWLRRHFISGTHHDRHHEKFSVNFGLYFCFMDRLMKTEFIEEETREESKRTLKNQVLTLGEKV